MTYPESYYACMERFILAIDHIAWLTLQPEHQDKIFLVVTHGYYSGALELIFNQQIGMAEGCGLACLKAKSNERKMELYLSNVCNYYKEVKKSVTF